MEYNNHQDRDRVEKIIQRIQVENDFLITTHIRPDGDCIASILVFASLIKFYNKRCFMILDDDIQNKYDFIPGINEIHRFFGSVEPFKPRNLVVLDSTSLNRIGNIQKIIPENLFIINIDHHPGNEQFGHLNLLEPNASSTIELVYRLISQTKLLITKAIATQIYTGIICDTGRFLHPNTNENAFTICAEMVKRGVQPHKIAQKLYYRSNQNTLKALGAALTTLEFYFEGLVSCIYLSQTMVPGLDDVDTEGFVDYLKMVEGSKIHFFMVEKESNVFRINLRSVNHVDVSKIARLFGGGGHEKAAGCTISGSLNDVKKKVLNALEATLNIKE